MEESCNIFAKPHSSSKVQDRTVEQCDDDQPTGFGEVK